MSRTWIYLFFLSVSIMPLRWKPFLVSRSVTCYWAGIYANLRAKVFMLQIHCTFTLEVRNEDGFWYWTKSKVSPLFLSRSHFDLCLETFGHFSWKIHNFKWMQPILSLQKINDIVIQVVILSFSKEFNKNGNILKSSFPLCFRHQMCNECHTAIDRKRNPAIEISKRRG